MNEKSRTENVVKNATISVAGQVIQLILSFVNRSVFIYYLSSDYLGLNGLFSNILSFLSLAELGVGSSILYAMYRPVKERDEVKISALMNYFAKIYQGIGILIFAIGVLLIPFFPYLISDPGNVSENIVLVYVIFLFNTASSYFFSYRQTIINADQNYYIINAGSLIINVLQMFLQIIILFAFHNYIYYLLVMVICGLLYNILIYIYSEKKYPFLRANKDALLSKDEKKSIFTNVKYIMVSKISGILVNNSDNIIITAISGLTEVGLTSNYYMITNAFNQLLNQIFNSVTASVGNLNASNANNEDKYRVFKELNLLNFWLYGFTMIAFLLMSNEFIELWIGENYCLSTPIIIVIAVNYYLVGMQNAVWVFKNTLGLFKYGRFVLFVTAFINILLSIIWGNYAGLFGILAATIVARIFTNVWYDPYIIYKRGFNKNFHSYLLRYLYFALVLFVSAGVTYWIMNLVIIQNRWISFGVHFIECLFVPNLIFAAMLYRFGEFKDICNLGRKIFCSVINKMKHKSM